MDFNNKTILISGLIIASLVAMYLNYEQIALAIVSGLVGYLSKDLPLSPEEPLEVDEVGGSDSETA